MPKVIEELPKKKSAQQPIPTLENDETPIVGGLEKEKKPRKPLSEEAAAKRAENLKKGREALKAYHDAKKQDREAQREELTAKKAEKLKKESENRKVRMGKEMGLSPDEIAAELPEPVAQQPTKKTKSAKVVYEESDSEEEIIIKKKKKAPTKSRKVVYEEESEDEAPTPPQNKVVRPQNVEISHSVGVMKFI